MEEKQQKCKTCGGQLIAVNDTYFCPYCENSYNTKFEKQHKTPGTEKSSAQAAVMTGADVYDQCIGGVLEIQYNGSQESWRGSGYIIGNDGLAVTNAHVASRDNSCRKCERLTVTVCGESVPAEVLAIKATSSREFATVNDLALIRLLSMPSGAHALKVADFDKVRNGEPIYVIGNSLGKGTCITNGIVSDRDRDGMVMYDCATNPGNSGGPVLNAKGQVIGTHASAQLGQDGGKVQGMNYAVPTNVLAQFVDRCNMTLQISD